MKKLFYRVRSFCHRVHLKFVQWFAFFFLRHANKSVRRLLTVGANDYQDLSYLSATLLTLASEVVRRHIVNVGKNPDYVAPTPRSAPEPTPLSTTRVTLNNPASSVHGEWVKNPEAHPVIKSRAAWNAKYNSIPEAMEININIVSDPAPTTVVDGEAVNAIREAISNIEKEFDLQTAESTEDKKSE